MEKIKAFLNVDVGYGDGYGYGSGDGSGYGVGSGAGAGAGAGDGAGYGDGYGSGAGYGDGSGSGAGSGYGVGIYEINGIKLNHIDGIETAIIKVVGNLAKGFILMSDLTLKPCYVVKQGNVFAHGETVEQARQSLIDKIFEDMDEEERIEMFVSEFENGISYPAIKFYEWHNKLTGSCEFGRKSFAENKGIDIENDSFTVKEFIELTEDAYNGYIIKELKKHYV